MFHTRDSLPRLIGSFSATLNHIRIAAHVPRPLRRKHPPIPGESKEKAKRKETHDVTNGHNKITVRAFFPGSPPFPSSFVYTTVALVYSPVFSISVTLCLPAYMMSAGDSLNSFF